MRGKVMHGLHGRTAIVAGGSVETMKGIVARSMLPRNAKPSLAS